MTETSEPCVFLEWDTEFFNHRIARVEGNRLQPDLLASILEWCARNQIECLYFLADSDDPQTIRLAQDHGFRLVEIRLTFERSLKDWDPNTRPKSAPEILIRPARQEDIPILQQIASTSYIDSRYYFDERFSEQKWQSFYATWVAKSCGGGADLALVAEKDGEVAGYITGLVDREHNQGIYELTGVRQTERRSGIGQELFRSGLDWYVQNGVDYIWVATQGRNVTTQRMILRHGFLTRSCQIYYHKWFN